MDINIPPPLPPQQPTNVQNATLAADVNAVKTEQTKVDNVVTSTEANSDTNTRTEDALRRAEQDRRKGSVKSYQNFRLDELKTRVGYDPDNEIVYVEILAPRTKQLVARIPSEQLVSYLNQQLDNKNVANPNNVKLLYSSFDSAV